MILLFGQSLLDETLNPIVVIGREIKRNFFTTDGNGNLPTGAESRVSFAIDLF